MSVQHQIIAERELASSPPVAGVRVRRYTCSCGEVIDAHPEVFDEAWAFHVPALAATIPGASEQGGRQAQ